MSCISSVFSLFAWNNILIYHFFHFNGIKSSTRQKFKHYLYAYNTICVFALNLSNIYFVINFHIFMLLCDGIITSHIPDKHYLTLYALSDYTYIYVPIS